jgi:ubiquinone/menaquinone biosynthesis C-methylase UbiE
MTTTVRDATRQQAMTEQRPPLGPTAGPAADQPTTAQPADEKYFSFEWFSSLAAYRDANRAQLEAFLSNLKLTPPWQGVDVACGVGLMAELTQEIGAKIGGFVQRIVCVDLDIDAVKIARERLESLRVDFVQALGDRLPLREGFGSFLTIGNGIHNFTQDQKASLFGEAFRVLKGGAALFFNSAFYEGTIVPGTERFYTDKVFRAVRAIGRGQPRAEAGERPEAAKHISPDEYVRLAQEAGFTNVQKHEVQVRMGQELWEAICSYGGYAQPALRFRYNAETSVRHLVQAVRDIFADPDWETKYPGLSDAAGRFIPRNWLWVTASKPA